MAADSNPSNNRSTEPEEKTVFDYDYDNKNEKFIFKDLILTPEMEEACEEFMHEEAFTRLGYVTPYFFSSKIYKGLLEKNKVKQVEFKKIFRQTDEKFLTTLNHIRLGEATREDLDYINSRVRTEKGLELEIVGTYIQFPIVYGWAMTM